MDDKVKLVVKAMKKKSSLSFLRSVFSNKPKPKTVTKMQTGDEDHELETLIGKKRSLEKSIFKELDSNGKKKIFFNFKIFLILIEDLKFKGMLKSLRSKPHLLKLLLIKREKKGNYLSILLKVSVLRSKKLTMKL